MGDLTRKDAKEKTAAELASEAALFDPTKMDDATATRMGFKTYEHGTTYQGGNAPTVSSNAAGTVTIDHGLFEPYQTQSGDWKLRFQIAVSHGADSGQQIAINGVTFKNLSVNQNCSWGGSTLSATGRAQAVSNDNYILVQTDVNTTAMRVSGDVHLESKPTWAY